MRQVLKDLAGQLGGAAACRGREILAITLLSIAQLSASPAPAVAQSATFQHVYAIGDKRPELIHPGSIEQTSDGGGVAAGVLPPDPNAGSPGGLFVVKFAADGSLQWSELLSLQDAIGGIHVSVRQTSDGGYIVSGRTRLAPLALLRLSPTGALQWAFAYDAQSQLAQFDSPRVREMSGGGFAVAGTEVNLPVSLFAGVLLLTDAAGTPIGGGRYPAAGGINTGFTDLRQNADGGFTIAGWLGTTTSSPNGLLMALRTMPRKPSSAVPPGILWAEDFGAQSTNSAVEQVAGGGFVFSAAGPQGTTLLSTDGAGTEGWSDSFQGFSANSIQVTPTGNLLLGGSAGTAAPVHPAMIATDAKGSFLAGMTYLSQQEGGDAAATVDGGALLVAGSSFGGPDADLLVVKSDATLASGCAEASFKPTRSVGTAGDQVNLTSTGGFTKAALAVVVLRLSTNYFLCQGTSCLEPPSDMVLWLPFDEPVGPTSLNAAGGNNGTLHGNPTPAPGRVDGGLCFDGQQDYVDVPSYPAIDFTTGDFSLDAWIRRGSGDDGVRVIVDKRAEFPLSGYSLYLYNGALGFQLADGTHDNYGSTATVPRDGSWHHVAVTVSRGDPAGGRFYVDGKAAGQPFNPMLHTGSLASGTPFRVGAEAFTVESVFKGCIDEVEAFNRVLTAGEIAALYAAGNKGKCKQSCFAAWASPFCPDPSSLVATEKVCNSLATAQTFAYSFRGLPVSAGCPAAGPTTFTPAAGSVAVPPGQCASVPVKIAAPAGLAPNLPSCYSLYIETAGGSRATACRGSVQVPRFLCWTWNDVGPTFPINQDLFTTWRIDNTGSGRSAGKYEVSAVDDQLAPAPAIRLNGQPPGVPVRGDFDLPAGGSANLDLLAGFRAYQPGRFFTLLAQADFTGDGTLVPLASRLLQNAIPSTCPPPSIVQRPASQSVAAGQPLTLSVVAADASPASYRWRRNGVDLADGGTVSGAASRTLTLAPASFGDAGLYDVVVTSACGVATSPAAAVSVAGETCAAGPTTLCLNAGRFAVGAQWQTPQGARGSGQAVQLTDETGSFSFFDPANAELAVKVLDACSLGNAAFWVFAAGLTNVDVTLTVTDTRTGAVKKYHNPGGQAFLPILDTAAFATCRPAAAPEASAGGRAHPERRPAAASPAAAATTLVLGGRFQWTARWQTATAAGAGHTLPLSGSSGLFWFFDSSNLELLVKVLDGCSLNGHYWVFAGGLTDVQVELVVTDTLTGAVKTYTSPGGTAFAPIQDTGAFATCP